MQDSATVEQALRALARSLLAEPAGAGAYSQPAQQIARLPKHHAVRACEHLLSLAPLCELLQRVPSPLHGLLVQACAANPAGHGGCGRSLSAADLQHNMPPAFAAIPAVPQAGLDSDASMQFLLHAAHAPSLAHLSTRGLTLTHSHGVAMQSVALTQRGLTSLAMPNDEAFSSAAFAAMACTALQGMSQLRALELCLHVSPETDCIVAGDAFAAALESLQLSSLALAVKTKGNAETRHARLANALARHTTLQRLRLQQNCESLLGAASELPLVSYTIDAQELYDCNVQVPTSLTDLAVLIHNADEGPFNLFGMRLSEVSGLRSVCLHNVFDSRLDGASHDDADPAAADIDALLATASTGLAGIAQLSLLTRLELSDSNYALLSGECIWLSKCLQAMPHLHSLSLRLSSECLQGVVSTAIARHTGLQSIVRTMTHSQLPLGSAPSGLSALTLTSLDLRFGSDDDYSISREQRNTHLRDSCEQLAQLPHLAQLVLRAGESAHLQMRSLRPLRAAWLQQLQVHRFLQPDTEDTSAVCKLASLTSLQVLDPVTYQVRTHLSAFSELANLQELAYIRPDRSATGTFVELPALRLFKQLLQARVHAALHGTLRPLVAEWLQEAADSTVQHIELHLVCCAREEGEVREAVEQFNMQHAGAKHCVLLAGSI